MGIPKAGRGKSREAEPWSAEFESLFDPLKTSTWDLIERARNTRRVNFGDRVHLCNILNAKSGACTEDCAFCSQSSHHRSSVSVYPLVSVREALDAAKEAETIRARCFSLVTSGRSLRGKRERQRLLQIIETLRTRTQLEVACSIGLQPPEFLRDLRSAGLCTYHHNLETASSHYATICTTHAYEERLRGGSEGGLTACSGGIFGMGESAAQRAEFALTLRQLEVDRIPVNFLNAIAGTAMEGRPRLTPLEALHTVAALRVAVPEQEILVCGGREVTLRSLQPLLFNAGANGIMTGRYLTTPGQGAESDQRMLADLELDFLPAVCAGKRKQKKRKRIKRRGSGIRPPSRREH